jgi:hypothetical protein
LIGMIVTIVAAEAVLYYTHSTAWAPVADRAVVTTGLVGAALMLRRNIRDGQYRWQ